MAKKVKSREELRAVVNASGFAFQLAVEQMILATTELNGWLVETREHPWRGEAEDGFIDLVLDKQPTRMVVECKRLQDAAWVFLVPKERQQPQLRLKLRWTDSGPGCEALTGWFDFNFLPESYESEFCTEYKAKKGHHMIEDIAAKLLASVEALANEQLEIDRRGEQPEALRINRQRFFMPTIVTTAELAVCHVDAKTISLDGTIGEHEFETVPWVRFRKSLTTEFTQGAAPTDLKEAHEDRVRTVMVVNAAHLLEFLGKWTLDKTPGFCRWPWEVLRELEGQRALTRGMALRSGPPE